MNDAQKMWACFLAGLWLGASVGALGMDKYNGGAAERLARDQAQMEMLLKIAPIWCGKDGCQ